MVTIVIPAFNEEENLRDTTLLVMHTAEEVGATIEIIIVNDGSRDGTAEIADGLAREFPMIRVIHQKTNLGIGQGFLEGARIARGEKITLITGDNNALPMTVKNLLSASEKADMVISYIMNTEARNRARVVLSMIYSAIYCATFGLPLKYVNGAPVYPVQALRTLDVKSRRYSFQAEVNVKLMRSGVTFVEVESYIRPNANKSSAMRLRNFVEVIVTYLRLVVEVKVMDRAKYTTVPRRAIPLEVQRQIQGEG